MYYLLFLLLPALSCTKVAFQGRLTRKNVAGLSGLCKINAASFAAISVIMTLIFIRQVPRSAIIIPAAVYGITTVLFQLFYMLAFTTGSIGITAAINNFGTVFPILTGLLIYHESVNAFKIAGMVLLAVPFILLPKKDGGGFGGAKWLAYTLIAVLSSGIGSSVQVVCSHNGFTPDESRQTIILGYVFAMVISAALMNFMPGHDVKTGFAKDKLFIPKILGIAVPLGLYNVLLATGLHYIPSTVMLPIVNISCMISILLLDLIMFGQKLDKRQYVGLGFAAVCVVLMNIG